METESTAEHHHPAPPINRIHGNKEFASSKPLPWTSVLFHSHNSVVLSLCAFTAETNQGVL
jgi:hypothetical protein